jgi:hypothetical protein
MVSVQDVVDQAKPSIEHVLYPANVSLAWRIKKCLTPSLYPRFQLGNSAATNGISWIPSIITQPYAEDKLSRTMYTRTHPNTEMHPS